MPQLSLTTSVEALAAVVTVLSDMVNANREVQVRHDEARGEHHRELD